MTDAVLLSVAPVDATATRNDPREIARDVLACAQAGAGMVHLHVRDPYGRLTPDTGHFAETLALIRAESDIVIEASTGGVSPMTIAERCTPLALADVECASLNVGSVNLGKAVYINPSEDVRWCVREILRTGKVPEVEIFEIGMMDVLVKLQGEFGIPDPLFISLVFGHEGAAPATPEALIALRGAVPSGSVWGITHSKRIKNDLIAAAIGLGAKTVRIGFEDSPMLDQHQPPATTNAPIVAHMVAMLRGMGKRPMTPTETRALLGIKPLGASRSVLSGSTGGSGYTGPDRFGGFGSIWNGGGSYSGNDLS